jgi:AcrR family transcriptional regulator
MPATRSAVPARKRRSHYHHGDLRRALIDEAARTILARGVEHLTLRGVGQGLGVSRTALYRHFSDKAALLAAVGAEGFRQLRGDLEAAWQSRGGGRDGFAAMGEAYVRFAMNRPSYYRVMFGGLLESGREDCELTDNAGAAFQVLVDAVIAQQDAGLVRLDDPRALSRYIWATVHGIAMLGIDGLIRPEDGGAEALTLFANERLREALAAPGSLS